LSHCARVQAAWTTITVATAAMMRHREPQAPAAAIVSRQARDPRSGARSRGLFSPRDRARPEPEGRGGRPSLNGEVASSESPDLIRAWHRARRHQDQALRVVAMRPTLTTPARGAGWEPGRDRGAATQIEQSSCTKGRKSGWSLTRGIGLQNGTVTRMGRDPPPRRARARGPLQARAVGPGRGRKAAGRTNWPRCTRGVPSAMCGKQVRLPSMIPRDRGCRRKAALCQFLP
jgi:hypothetical protein